MMNVPRPFTELPKFWLALAASVLVVWWARLPSQVRRPALLLLTALAFVNYSRWGPDSWVRRLDAYDLFHYYVNAKYIDELGYLDLYPAMLFVDASNGGPFFPRAKKYMAQDETGHHFDSVENGVKRGKVVMETRFTPERWTAFEHDVLVMQRDLGCRDRDSRKQCLHELDDKLWDQLINDHGFNGTPVWTFLAEPIANLVPVESLKPLGYLDVGLLAVGVAAVGWAYGLDVAAFAVLFFCVTYSTRWPYLAWVFLRYDWVAALLIAMAALKRGGRWGHLVAGLAAGWAATLRMFPALWMWGPMWRGLWGLWERELRRPLLVLAGGFLLAVGLLQGAATYRYGADRVSEHFENMMDHNSAEQLSSRRIGMAMALATEPWRGKAGEKLISKSTRALVGRQQPLRYALAVAGCIALGLAMRRRTDDEAFAWGFYPFFLLTTASYYYYIARITLIVVHAGNLDRPRHRAGLVMLLLLEAGSAACEVWAEGYRMMFIGGLAWGLVAYGVVQIGWMFADREGERPAP